MTARADQLRQARIDMEEAMAAGLTIPQLRARRAEDRRHLRQRAQIDVSAHTDDLLSSPSEAGERRAFEQFGCRWMQRD